MFRSNTTFKMWLVRVHMEWSGKLYQSAYQMSQRFLTLEQLRATQAVRPEGRH